MAKGAKAPRIVLQHIAPDPVVSLRCAPLHVPFAGQEHTIPALPAARWLEVLLAEKVNLEAVFPGLAGTEAVMAVNLALAEQQASQDDLEEVIYEVLEAAAGRSWWIALRLCQSLRSHWEWVGGAMARNGVTPFEVPLAFWLDAAYATMIHEMATNAAEEQDLARIADWNRALTAPPAKVARTNMEDTMDRDAFLALARQHGRF